ncbi:MAG: helix-turn-helix transcriptional regulator [Daejeonella sp.]|uniref:helix-turn-helix domain-containing protein n=1 Tax=Daejeonella sp. TaxID=2805397 RepID=UPI0027324D50|nr:helix-turn-helix transcriptional regulator [Daejeonella sp.]MDP3467552.1 helix-turn-helix transcriptional regulator [Daejeonella sp.]
MGYLKDQEFIGKFGKQLKKVREGRGLSQEELALKSNISQSQIARTELGSVNTSISHVNAYAKALGIDVKELFDF